MTQLSTASAFAASSYTYCPRCATPLVTQTLGDRPRARCPACDFVHWNNPLPVVAAVLELDDKLLLARNAAWPQGMFGLITGFMESGETPEQAIAREVKEETDLNASACTLIGVYEFMRKNELIIAYHVRASGEVRLSEELVDFRLLAPERARPWRAGTGYALADWLKSRGIDFQWLEIPQLATNSA
jgi:NAD+ diphosphatase